MSLVRQNVHVPAVLFRLHVFDVHLHDVSGSARHFARVDGVLGPLVVDPAPLLRRPPALDVKSQHNHGCAVTLYDSTSESVTVTE